MNTSAFTLALLSLVFSTTSIAANVYELELAGRYETGLFDKSAAEIVAYDKIHKRAFVVNASAAGVEVLDISNPAAPIKIATLAAGIHGSVANSVAVNAALVAVAVQAKNKTDAGRAVFYDAQSLEELNTVAVGALPDMLAFSPNGQWLLVANEGEPSDDYELDPEGSVSVIDLSQGVAAASVTHASFAKFNSQTDSLRAAGVRIFGPQASVAQDLEPEYIAISEDSRTAWVSLQENNAIAVLDIASAEFTRILPLGYKDHSVAGNGLDASDKDKAASLANWPVFGMYQPDAIAVFRDEGNDYLVTANEGDARDYPGFSEEIRVSDMRLDKAAFPHRGAMQDDKKLARLKVTRTLGDSNADGKYEKLYSFGARSFSIRSAQDGELVYDSGDDFERITAGQLGRGGFNADNDEQGFDQRSDAKGPEPEGLATGMVAGRRLLFIGLERVGGIMIYDITTPHKPVFQSYFNGRDFSTLSLRDAGDLGPEGLTFISAADSPNGKPLLAVANEVSGSTAIYTIHRRKQEPGNCNNPNIMCCFYAPATRPAASWLKS